jgi:hypothetical protein
LRHEPAQGELSKYTIDIRWPHQVALRADQCTGRNHQTIHDYIAQERLSRCDRGLCFYRDGVGFNVYCFAERFQQRFSGEFINPKDRPRWPRRR